MRSGSSRILSRGRGGRNRLDARLTDGRKTRVRWLELEGLESRRLLSTTPAPAATGNAVNLTNLGSVTSGGNANSPTVVIDPYNPEKVFAVWSVDLSSLTPTVPHTTSVVEGAYSNDGGASWTSFGTSVAPVLLDPLTINSNPPTAYTQVTEPSVAFDGANDVYVLSLETTGANDGALELTKFNFSGNTPSRVYSGTVYQWVTGSDAATDPTLAADTAPPSGTSTPDPYTNNVYIAWASIDAALANPNVYGTNFNPNRAELVVGTPSGSGLAFSGVQTVNAGGNFSPQHDSHPQLVINQNSGGQVTVAWDDFGSGSTASPPFDELMSNLAEPGFAYGFADPSLPGPIQPATSSNNVTTPVTTSFQDSVSVPVSQLGNLDDLTVTVALVDQESVQNLNLTLIAPDGVSKITLVNNQNNAAGTANTGTGLPGGNAIGVYGFSTGQTGTFGTTVGTRFDDNATRDIFDSTTTGTNGNSATNFIGYFRPEFGSLRSFLASLGGNVNGTWTLAITNYTATLQTNVADQGELRDFSLQFSTGMTQPHRPSLIDITQVTGALGNTFARTVPASPTGVGPGLVMAIDNTLGPYSPYQGRIYAAFVGYTKETDPNQHVNPATNTDIYLDYSDDGGQTWSSAGVVNSDNAQLDGNSGSGVVNDLPFYADTSGRTQFQPAIAVDQASGTLVVSWRDARDDAANARVATYLTTSLDGGFSFSPQAYANPAETATDAITGATDAIGPEGDNQSGGNPQTDHTFGYGDQMGLAVFDGQVYPVWAGNLNQSNYINGAVVANPLDIWYRPMAIPGGPRIISSTMGPISYLEATSRAVTIEIDFDRPVIASSFVKQDVLVYFRGTAANDNFVQLAVTGVAPLGGTNTGIDPNAYTSFIVTFNPLPAGANALTYDYTGTYSYMVLPDNGGGSGHQLADRVLRRHHAPHVRPDGPERRRRPGREPLDDAERILRHDPGRRVRRPDAGPYGVDRHLRGLHRGRIACRVRLQQHGGSGRRRDGHGHRHPERHDHHRGRSGGLHHHALGQRHGL